MKKMILAGAVLALSAQLSHAQLSIAPEAGISLSNFSLGGQSTLPFDLQNKTGFRAGANLNIQLGSGLFLQPGLFYTMRGAQYKESDVIMGVSVSDKVSFNLNYIEMPVNVGYQYSFGKAGAIFATAGPYVACGISANTKESITVDGHTQTTTDKVEFGDELKRMDIGMNFGLGYKIPVGVYVRAQYSLGLANINGSGDGSIKNKGFAFTVGYEFMLKHKAKVATK